MAENANNRKGPRTPWQIRLFGWIVVIICVLFLLNFATGVVNFGFEAQKEAQRVLSVKNIKEQQTAIIEDWQQLLVATGNACEAVNAKSDENSPTLVENPAMAYAATARKARTDYNRRQKNLFEAEKVGPSGYPKTVPEGPAMDARSPDWCAISKVLHETHE